MQIQLGQIVLYTLGMRDVNEIQRQRRDGKQLGNAVRDGETFPGMVVKITLDEFGANQHGVNLRVLLDGSDFLWVTSRKYDDQGTQGTWRMST